MTTVRISSRFRSKFIFPAVKWYKNSIHVRLLLEHPAVCTIWPHRNQQTTKTKTFCSNFKHCYSFQCKNKTKLFSIGFRMQEQQNNNKIVHRIWTAISSIFIFWCKKLTIALNVECQTIRKNVRTHFSNPMSNSVIFSM